MSSADVLVKKNANIIHYIITALLIFGGAYVPPIAPITPTGMAVLGVFLGAVYGWTTINMLWPSLMGLVGLSLAVGATPVLAASFGNPIIAMLFPLFALIALLNETNVTDVIASFFISNKLAIGRPWVMVFLFLLGAYICSLINVFVSMLLFIVFVRDICKKADIKPFTAFPCTMLLGVAFAIMNGQIMFPFLNTGITLSGAFSAMSGEIFPYAQYMAFMIPMNILMIGTYVLIMRFVLRIDVSNLKNLTAEMMGEKKSLSKDQKVALTFLGLIILVLLSASLMPKTWAFAIFLSKITQFGQVAIIIGLLMIFKKEDGTPFFDFNALASKGMAWDCIFMTCLIMPISSFLTADNTGIKEFLANALTPMTHLSPFIFIVVIMAFAALVTNFANNTILAVIIMPVLYSFSIQVGLNPYGMVALLFIATQMAMATPGASPFSGMAYSATDLVKTSSMMKYAAIAIPLLFIVCMAVGIPYSFLIF